MRMPSMVKHKWCSGLNARIRWAKCNFRRDRSGATAIEFGLVALPFTALMFAVLETAIVLFANHALDTATGDAARLIRTGQAQQQGFSADAFRQKICDSASILFDCDSIKVDVQRYPTFGTVDLSTPLDENGNFVDNARYLPGNGGDVVVVRAFYEWPVVVKLMGHDLTNTPSGRRLLAATAAFRNEPFPW